MNLTLSDTAYTHIGNLLKQHDKKYVRLQVKGGGCAGFEYEWSFEDEAEKDDEVIELPKGKFLIDPASIMYLIGSKVDYKKEVFGSYFSIENPASTSSCGCGESIGF